MADTERGFFAPHNSDFQPVIGYRTVEAAPFQVVKQTHALLDLYYRGAVRNSRPVRDYLHDYTLVYLNKATEGADILYDRVGQLIAQAEGTDIETREAAGHAFVVLACLPDKAKSSYLPKGFSRKGMLQAPATRRQFLVRIKELKFGILQIVEGQVEPHATLEAYPPVLRVFKFFEVGSQLPIRQTPDAKKQAQLEREQFNDLLGGIDISFNT